MSEEFLAINHIQRKLNATNPIHGALLFCAPQTGESAKLVLSNPSVDQTISRNLSIAGGALNLSSAISNVLNFGTVGSGAPTFTTRSAGAKVVYKSGLTSTTTEYADGIESTGRWFSMPVNSTANNIYFYGGTTRVATLTGAGGLTVNSLNSTSLTTGALTATGNVNISGTLTVSGATTVINSTTVDVKDRVIHVNHSTGTTPVPTLITGLAVHRGNTGSADREHASVVWDESLQAWALAFTTTTDSGYGTGGNLPLIAKQITVDSNPSSAMQVATKSYVDATVSSGGATVLLSTNNVWSNTNTWNGSSYFNGLVKITGAPAALQLNNAFIYADQSNPSVINIGANTSGQPTVTINPTTNTVSFANNANVILPNAQQSSNIFLGPLIPIAPVSTNVYTLPYDQTNEFIYAGGIPQVRNSDYILNGDGTFSFTPPLVDSSIEVTGTAASNAASAQATASSASSHFVEIGPGNGVTTYFTLPGSQSEEIIILDRTYLCKRGTLAGGSASGDYYIDNGDTVVFFTPPGPGISVMASVSILLLAGTDAQTVQNKAPSINAVANTVAIRTATGNLFATQNQDLGSAASENAVIVADANGLIPAAVLPDTISVQTINGIDINDFILATPGSPAAADASALGGQSPSYYAPKLAVNVITVGGSYSLNAWSVAITKLSTPATVNYTLPQNPPANTQVIIKDAGYTAASTTPINVLPSLGNTVENTTSLKIVGAGNSITLIFDGISGWWII